MISCGEAVRQLWDFLEREVSAADAARVQEHLDVCRRCCGELEFAEELRSFLRSSAEVEMPQQVRQRMESFLDSLEATP